MIASLWFLNGLGSPVDVEPPTIEEVRFHELARGPPIGARDVPARLFSEIMRDVDLVVSVAHVAGVDPEASQSSLRCAARSWPRPRELLGCDNVAVEAPRP